MVEEGRYCVDVLQQIASLRSGADAVGRILLEDHIRGCVAESVHSDHGDGWSPDEMVGEIMSVVRRAVRT
jgi:DNA-binding FrmR family transcriptional regulator